MANVLKYMDIVEWTIQQIASGIFKPKDKFLSETELGSRFNCSRQTVRRALDVLEQRGQVIRVQGSGTYIAEIWASGKSQSSGPGKSFMTIGLISTFLDNYIFPSIVRGIEAVFSEKGHAVQLASTNNLVSGETSALRLMLARKLDGLIVEPTRSALPCANLGLYNSIMERKIPLVFIDSFYPELSNPYVALDDEKAGYLATRHLLDMGHTKIAGIFPHSNRQGHLRYLGYIKALSEEGLPIQDDMICWHSKENMKQILHSNILLENLSRCTAVLCYNDWTALMVMDFVKQQGWKIPEDLSVVGIDNSELARISSLSSIVHPAERLGEAAAKLLLSMISGEKGETILFPPKLVERSSVMNISRNHESS